MGDVLLGVANSSYVIITNETQYGYKFQKTLDKYDLRTKGGTLYTYITPAGTHTKWNIPMTFVNSSKRSQINSWFETGTDLRFIEDDSFANSYYTVRITGRVEPFTRFVKPYFRQYYEGEIVIETT